METRSAALERLVGEGQDGVAEGGLQGVGAATEVEDEGEADGVVAFEPKRCGWEGGPASSEMLNWPGRGWVGGEIRRGSAPRWVSA